MMKSYEFPQICALFPLRQDPKELVSHSLPAPPGPPGRTMQAMKLMLDVFFLLVGWGNTDDEPGKKVTFEVELSAFGKTSCRILD